MYNMDLSQTHNGLIPSKTLYPLFVPQGDLTVNRVNNRSLLAFLDGQGLNIPNSSLLTPDGNEWVVILRAYIQSNGLILSQENDTHGFCIYVKDFSVQAVLRSSHTAITLKEDSTTGITNVRKRWVTIELHMKRDRTYLILNRKRVCMIDPCKPLDGDNMNIRLGTHNRLPNVMKNKRDMSAMGFTGAISSLKFFRN